MYSVSGPDEVSIYRPQSELLLECAQFNEQYHAGHWNLHAREHGYAAVCDAADGHRCRACTGYWTTYGQRAERTPERQLFRRGQMDWRAVPRDYAVSHSIKRRRRLATPGVSSVTARRFHSFRD